MEEQVPSQTLVPSPILSKKPSVLTLLLCTTLNVFHPKTPTHSPVSTRQYPTALLGTRLGSWKHSTKMHGADRLEYTNLTDLYMWQLILSAEKTQASTIPV